MTFRRNYAIPDIHGRLDLLLLALQLMSTDGYDTAQDLLIFLGDLVDRGPNSKGVIDTVMALQAASPDTVVVLRGNHENLAVGANVGANDKILWYFNGGIETEASYPGKLMSEEHVKFLATRPLSFEVGDFYFSHAPVPRDKHRTGRVGFTANFGDAGTDYTVWERTWHYMGIEGEKPGGMMNVHEGPRSQNGTGNSHLIGLCGHIHRGAAVCSIRTFPKYRMLDCGCGCFPDSPLAVHECISNRTLYAYPPKAVAA